ncbi:MAG: threonylcarbamoyl-AMP synthase [Ruminococcus sp.]|nr:threonylcarbamoyl-AMP synthase [Ruminococcus sp.]
MAKYQTVMLDGSELSVKKAAAFINAGEVVGMPTETVYGLAADAFNEEAVAKIFAAKERPADNPLIVHISDLTMITGIAAELPQLAVTCAKRFWPGPLTMVLPKTPNVPFITSGGLDTVGVRMPSHPVARALIDAAGVPLAAPSANLSGSPSPTCAAHVLKDMNGRIPAIIDGGECDAGVESTVICFEEDGGSGKSAIKILRPGRITAQMLSEVTPHVLIDKGVLNAVENGAKVASPGMKYKHYAPKAKVTLVDGTAELFAEYVKAHAGQGTVCLVFRDTDIKGLPCIVIGDTAEEQAHRLFAALREADSMGAAEVFARCPTTDGVGLAVYNRLIRAAAFRVVKL